MGVSKNRGKTPKMDGENNGKPYEQMDDLGGKPPLFLGQHPYSLMVFVKYFRVCFSTTSEFVTTRLPYGSKTMLLAGC